VNDVRRYDVREFTVGSTDGVTVAGYDLGGAGPVAILCHATGFCGMVWYPLATALTEWFHCYTLDFRAHGHSTRPHGDNMAWTGMAADILAVVDAVADGRPVHGIGHSLGGGSMVLAESARPGTFAACWAYEPILFAPPPPGEPPDAPHKSHMSEQARRRRAVFADREEVYERYRSRPPLNRLDVRCLRAYVNYGFRDRDDGAVELSCSPENEARTFEQHRTGADEMIGRLPVPYTMAIGAERERPAEAVIEVAERFPHLGLVRYPDLDHFGPLEQPERLAADIAGCFGQAT
jgi:pimeloyl-ACP methyl ester carboxylesterase